MIIYTITSLVWTPNQHWDKFQKRIVGYFTDIEKAKQCVEEDWGGFCECLYNFIVIEKVYEGLYNLKANHLDEQVEWWYSHNDESNKWVVCEKPAEKENIINFGIG